MIKEKTREPAGKTLLPADRAAETLPFDRRKDRRASAGGAMMAAFVSDRTGITLARVEMRDASRSGAGLRCPLPIEPGARFSLHRDGASLSKDHGTVARCIEAKDHFVLGLRFDPRAAA